jgi:hypothetical protein
MSRSEFLVSMEEIRYTWETSLVDVHGIGTNKLVIRGGHILYLYDVLYALDIQRDLFSIVIMLKLGFWFFLKSNSIEIYLGINFYSCGHFRDYFLVLDVNIQVIIKALLYLLLLIMLTITQLNGMLGLTILNKKE